MRNLKNIIGLFPSKAKTNILQISSNTMKTSFYVFHHQSIQIPMQQLTSKLILQYALMLHMLHTFYNSSPRAKSNHVTLYRFADYNFKNLQRLMFRIRNLLLILSLPNQIYHKSPNFLFYRKSLYLSYCFCFHRNHISL